MSFSQTVARFNGGLSSVNEKSHVGDLLQDAGKLTAADAEHVCVVQKTENLRFGEAALKLGLITEVDLQQALSRQFSYTYLAPGEGDLSPELISAYQPFGHQVEKFRALRSQLMLRWFSRGNKILTLAGIHPGDGTSYLAANLAIVFAQLGERTLLIDADLRQPRQHALFNLGNRAGLSDFLAGRASTTAVVHLPAIPNLSILTSGAVPPNPAELLSRSTTSAQLEDLSLHYDVVLLDTSAVEGSSDAAMVAAHGKGALLVLQIGRAHV